LKVDGIFKYLCPFFHLLFIALQELNHEKNIEMLLMCGSLLYYFLYWNEYFG